MGAGWVAVADPAASLACTPFRTGLGLARAGLLRRLSAPLPAGLRCGGSPRRQRALRGDPPSAQVGLLRDPGLRTGVAEPVASGRPLPTGLPGPRVPSDTGTPASAPPRVPACSRELLLCLWAVRLWQVMANLPSISFQATMKTNLCFSSSSNTWGRTATQSDSSVSSRAKDMVAAAPGRGGGPKPYPPEVSAAGCTAPPAHPLRAPSAILARRPALCARSPAPPHSNRRAPLWCGSQERQYASPEQVVHMVTCGRICLQARRSGSASRLPGRPPREAAELRLQHSGDEKPALQGRAGPAGCVSPPLAGADLPAPALLPAHRAEPASR